MPLCRSCLTGLCSIALLTLFASCSGSKKMARSRTPLRVAVEQVYQRAHPFAEYLYIDTLRTENVGIAFSGGGSRAAAATTGQLRALNHLHLMDKVRYISSVSGGTWASVAYTYLPESISDEAFLGKYLPPDSITMASLWKTSKPSLTYILSHGIIFFRLIANWVSLKGDETFSSILNSIYLKRIGIGDRRKYFSYDNRSVSAILSRNKSLTREDFYTVNPRPNRPFLIVNSTFIGGVRNSRALPSMHLEITPLYSGITTYNKEHKIPVGGGYIETFGMDTEILTTGTAISVASVRPRQIFSLSDAMAMSGNAPGTVLNRNPVLSPDLGLPEIYMWSPYQHWDKRFELKKTSREYAIGDGGNSENLGIIPLLKRKVDRIIVFVNSMKKIDTNERGKIVINDAVSKVFGVFQTYTSSGLGDMAVHVLKNEKGELDTLKNELFRLSRNKKEPLIITHKYAIMENPDFGVYSYDDYDSVQITWVYNDNVESFLNILRDTTESTKDEKLIRWINSGRLNQRRWPFNNMNFPHYATFGTTSYWKGIDYRPTHANLLNHFASWVVVSNQDTFRRIILGNNR